MTHLISYAKTYSACVRLAKAPRDKTVCASFGRAFDRHWQQWQVVAVGEVDPPRRGFRQVFPYAWLR